MKIPIGTRSLIYGSHQFFLHPLFVMYAWIELYRWTLDPRIWMAAIVHDWGYWGCKTIDGGDGKYHPTLGGWIMLHLFGTEWAKFTMYHSREYAQMNFAMPSPLAAADKLAPALMPPALYLFLIRLSGEIEEYAPGLNKAQQMDKVCDYQARCRASAYVLKGYNDGQSGVNTAG